MADNKIEPCPGCGGEMRATYFGVAHTDLSCTKCHYRAGQSKWRDKLIAAHNRVSCNNAIVDELGKALEGFVTDYDEGFPAGDNMQANLPTARAAIAKWKGEQDV